MAFRLRSCARASTSIALILALTTAGGTASAWGFTAPSVYVEGAGPLAAYSNADFETIADADRDLSSGTDSRIDGVPPLETGTETETETAPSPVSDTTARLARSPMVGASAGGAIRAAYARQGANAYDPFAAERLPYRPASTLKLLTAYAALKHLPPDFKFETRVEWSSDGDGTASAMKLSGGGDPTWVFPEALPEKATAAETKSWIERSPFVLRGLIEELRAKKIRRIVGPIVFTALSPGLDRRGPLAAPRIVASRLADVRRSGREIQVPEGWDAPEKLGDYFRREDEFGVIPGSFNFPSRGTDGLEWDNGDLFETDRFGCSDDAAPTDEARIAYRARFPNVWVDCDQAMVMDSELARTVDNGRPTAAKWNPAKQLFVVAGKKIGAAVNYSFRHRRYSIPADSRPDSSCPS